ncbi:uncharacterized protein LOC114432438 [Parambassis ranga]|uniref:Uncharacterized protein LOC114432438 n=1 Tax=Parambassis ranga TaxID=210632 RepID=A0A6P7I0H0_9TELE|nr:uncharacterized protein LOC114432438 [Parambassis ranga]
MEALTWILTVLTAAGCHFLSAASPALRSALVVQAGQNVSLPCNVTPGSDITWYRLRSDLPLPLITVTKANVGEDTGRFYSVSSSHVSWTGGVEDGCISLDIQQVEEEDAGLYFCIGRSAAGVCVNRGVRLTVTGADEDTDDKMWRPCWSLGICVLPALLALCMVCGVGVYLYSGKPAVCCCNPGRPPGVPEEVCLHYSSLKHPDKPRPSGCGGTRLVREDVTYSTVNTRKKPRASHDLK